eukprot:scaffold12957_cov148-Skeletonema_marinoi.AAC.10
MAIPKLKVLSSFVASPVKPPPTHKHKGLYTYYFTSRKCGEGGVVVYCLVSFTSSHSRYLLGINPSAFDTCTSINTSSSFCFHHLHHITSVEDHLPSPIKECTT